MKCLRCGYCCKSLCVVIVDDPDIGPVYENLKAINALEEPCHHLLGDKPGEYSCAIHDKDWYPETPCFEYTQLWGDNCRMGGAVLSRSE